MAPISPPPGYTHGYTYFYLYRDFRTMCMWVACASFVANFLPNKKRLDAWPRSQHVYVWFIDFVAFVALNFRVCLPSLQQEFMGFRRRWRRRVEKRQSARV